MQFAPRTSFACSIFAFLVVHGIAAEPPWIVKAWQGGGLSGKRINGLAQTSDGYMWAATESGLVRLDANETEEFSNAELNQRGGAIQAIANGRSGELWLGNYYGDVIRFASGEVKLFGQSSPRSTVHTLCRDAAGAIWTIRRDGTVSRIQGDALVSFGTAEGLPNARDASLTCDSDGNIWCAKGGLLCRFDGARFVAVSRIREWVSRLASSYDGGVWLCLRSQLFHCGRDNVLEDMGSIGQNLGELRPTALLEDRAGNLWIGTSPHGLFHFDRSTGFKQVETSHGDITELLEDAEGNVWVGTGGGLNMLYPREIALEKPMATSYFESIQSVSEAADGSLWAVTNNTLLSRGDNGDWRPRADIVKWYRENAKCLAFDVDGGMWIGLQPYKVLCFKGGNFEGWGRAEGLRSHTIRILLPTASRDVWVAGEGPNTLQFIRNGTLHTVLDPPDVQDVEALAEDALGGVWIAASGGKLFKASQASESAELKYTPPKKMTTRCLAPRSDGTVWIVYEGGGGLGRFRNGQWTQVGKSEGVPIDDISQLAFDNNGWVWCAAGNRLYKLRVQELEAVMDGRHSQLHAIGYGVNNGLPENVHFSETAFPLHSRDGRLWFVANTTLAIVQPEKLRRDPIAPPVLIKAVKIDERKAGVYRGILPAGDSVAGNTTKWHSKPMPIELTPAFRKLELQYAALTYRSPKDVRFRHRLEGFDGDWVTGDSSGIASYSRLLPGTYRFRIAAGNIEGNWSTDEATLEIRVMPFLWQHRGIQFGAFILFAVSLGGAVRYVSHRRFRRSIKRLHQRAALDRERARIARDLHDELGSSLTEISLLSALALQNVSEGAEKDRRFAQIASAAQLGIKMLDETVWAVNPSNDTLSDLIEYVGAFTARFLQSANIHCELDLPLATPAFVLSAEVRHNIFMVVKEGLNNAVRHAHATEVHLTILLRDHWLEGKVADNGKGFVSGELEPTSSTADGLRNMERRMQDIGGRAEIKSSPGKGTSVHFSLPLTSQNK